MAKSFVIPIRNVVITDSQAELVDRLVRSGRFATASAVVREGLALLERREAMPVDERMLPQGALPQAATGAPVSEPADLRESTPGKIEASA